MALYIEIRRTELTDAIAEYVYRVSNNRTGRVSVDLSTNAVELIEAAPGDEDRRYASRAIRKLQQHLNAGALPEKTCWAS